MKKRLLCLALALVLVVSVGATAFGRISPTLADYSSWINPVGSGEIFICFDVIADGFADEVGVSQIVLEENQNGTWRAVKTFTKTSYPELYTTDETGHGGEVSYMGVIGRQYRAKVTFYAMIGNIISAKVQTTKVEIAE